LEHFVSENFGWRNQNLVPKLGQNVGKNGLSEFEAKVLSDKTAGEKIVIRPKRHIFQGNNGNN
jgi:hypothetical protein